MKSVKNLAMKSLVLLVSSTLSLQAMDQSPIDKKPINVSIWERLFLHYMNMGKGFCGKSIGNHVRATRSKADGVSWYNRVFTIDDKLDQEVVNEVKNYMEGADFGWWVADGQPLVKELLEQNDFVVTDSEPAMMIDLNTYDFEPIRNRLSKKYEQHNEKRTFKKVETEDDIDEWIATSAAGFEIDPKEQAQFVQYLLDNGDQRTYSFYTGYFEGIAASTGLMIEHKDQKMATLHLVSTIPHFRGQLLATLLSLSAMLDAKADGYNCMLLISSAMAYSLYQVLGFKECTAYTIYELAKHHQTSSDEDEVYTRLGYKRKIDNFSFKLKSDEVEDQILLPVERKEKFSKLEFDEFEDAVYFYPGKK